MEKERKEVRIEDAMAEKEALDKKAQEILEEKDADSRLRVYKGPLGKAIIVLLCVWTAFQLYFTTIGAISAVNLRAIHTIFLLVLHSFSSRRSSRRRGNGRFRLYGISHSSWARSVPSVT